MAQGKPVVDKAVPMRVLVAHPSPDVYGSDLQLLETVKGLVDAGSAVTVAVPMPGPLVRLLTNAGAEALVVPFPVLRKSLLRPARLVRLLLDVMRFLTVCDVWRHATPDRVLVNTLTIPWWIVGGRLRRIPVVCHVHEAEDHQPAPIRLALAAPLLLARGVAANSAASRDVLVRSTPGLRRRTTIIHNGVPRPDVVTLPRMRSSADAIRLVQVGRLSPRKGTDVALEALALLRADGRDVRLRLCGTVFPGYEWFEDQLRSRAAEPDLVGAVEFLGYVPEPALEVAEADIVLVPSRAEPFGNVAVEALMAHRPVIASRVQGLAEIVRDGHTGLLVEPASPESLAAGIRALIDNPSLALSLADNGSADAVQRFGVKRYHARMIAFVGL